MSKSSKKSTKGKKKVTDYFIRSSVTSSPASSSGKACRPQLIISSPPTQSQKVHAPASSQGQKRSATSSEGLHLTVPDADVISISSGPVSHISISSGSRSHITISDSPAPIVVTGTAKAVKAKESPSSSEVEIVPMKKASKARMAPSSSARTSVRRTSLRSHSGGKTNRPPKRKFQLDSDSDIPAIEKVPYPKDSINTSASASHYSSPLGPPSSLPPLTPEDGRISLPSDDAVSVASGSASKRVRLSPPSPSRPVAAVSIVASGNEADVEDVIPSSQSDEQELTVPKQITKDPILTRIEVDKWRQETVTDLTPVIDLLPDHVEPPELETAMDVDVDIGVGVSESVTLRGSSSASPARSSTDINRASNSQASEAEVDAQLHDAKPEALSCSQETAVPAQRADWDVDDFFIGMRNPTPPPLDAPAPPTPVAIDTATKTQNIINSIRASVLAGMRSSSPAEEAHVTSVPDELSSSDDEQLKEDIFSLNVQRKPYVGYYVTSLRWANPCFAPVSLKHQAYR